MQELHCVFIVYSRRVIVARKCALNKFALGHIESALVCYKCIFFYLGSMPTPIDPESTERLVRRAVQLTFFYLGRMSTPVDPELTKRLVMKAIQLTVRAQARLQRQMKRVNRLLHKPERKKPRCVF